MTDDGFRGLSLSNTMTRRREELRPLDWRNASIADADKRVRMYVCGPTVYDYAHVGNARPLIVFDVLFRLLRHLYGDDGVTYVRNITDVDDKINARAARDFPSLPLNEAIVRVTKTTADQFARDADALGCLRPTYEPRATAFVSPRDDGRPDMVSMIGELLRNGYAYEAGGEVLFDVSSMHDYGALSRRRLDEQQAGARVAVEANKRNPADFVLWKLSDENEPGWDSPWGRGRPGWHIECSVMAEAYLGRTFDIHGGGLDLIFPHHENEIAQSRCAHRTEMMAQIWMHNGFVQVEGRKMAKSEGNFVTIHDLLQTEQFGGRRWKGEVLRLAMLMTHYREPIDFSVRRLEEAEDTLRIWGRAAAEVAPSRPSEAFVAAWADDLGSTAAIVELHNLRRSDAASLRASLDLIGVDVSAYGSQNLDEIVTERRHVSHLDIESPVIQRAINREEIEDRIAERSKLLEARDFSAADEVRAKLLERGIQLKDGKDPSTGKRITTWEVKR